MALCYFETLHLGRWTPRASWGDKPRERPRQGDRPATRRVVRVAPLHEDCGLDELQAIYGTTEAAARAVA